MPTEVKLLPPEISDLADDEVKKRITIDLVLPDSRRFPIPVEFRPDGLYGFISDEAMAAIKSVVPDLRKYVFGAFNPCES